MVNIGDMAPNTMVKLVTQDQVNVDFELKQAYEKGIIVLYFFPLAFTKTCTDSNCQLRDDMQEFESLNAHVYSISVDTPFTLQEFMRQNNLKQPLLSDFNKKACKAFDACYEQLAGLIGVAKRSVFVIKDGKITYKWITDNAGDYPPFDEVKEHLKTL